MTSSWELPDNPRRVARRPETPKAPKAKSERSSLLRGTLIAILSLTLLGGAATGAYAIYVHRRNTRYEKYCAALREARQWRQLHEVSQTWLKESPRNIRGIFFAAQSAEKLGEYETAVELLLSSPRNHPLAAIALAEAAEIQFSKLNQPVKAVENFEAALKIDPREIESRHRLIFFYAMTMQRKKMIEHIHEAIRLGVESREHYVYLVGSEWLIFSNGPQYNYLWRTSDVENEHFNVARALGVVANGYVTPPSQALASGERAPYLLTGDSGIDPNAPDDVKEREVHYDSVLRAYLEKYPNNIELLAFFLNRAVSGGDAKTAEYLLSRLPPEALEDGRFWRYKGGWQLMVAKSKPQSDPKRAELLLKALESFREARRRNPYDMTAMHQQASILREMGEMREVEELEAIAAEGLEIRRLVLQSDSARIDPELFDRIRAYVALCGESEIADAMAQRLQVDRISSEQLLQSH
jgi:tetratricopeptide (TPR) repeat protein